MQSIIFIVLGALFALVAADAPYAPSQVYGAPRLDFPHSSPLISYATPRIALPTPLAPTTVYSYAAPRIEYDYKPVAPLRHFEQTYVAPRYAAPAPIYEHYATKPIASSFSYVQRSDTHHYAAPAPIYHAPAPTLTYAAPTPIYRAALPAPVYHAPAPVYHAPAPTLRYAAPAPVAPHSTYGAPYF